MSLVVHELRDFLEAVEQVSRQNTKQAPFGPFVSYEGFVLKYGRRFASQTLTEAERKIVVDAIENFAAFEGIPQPGFCFGNAQMLAGSDDTKTLRYVEGYCSHIIPFLHGWCEINGKAIDITLRRDFNLTLYDVHDIIQADQWNLGEFPEEYEYYGILFPDLGKIVAQCYGPGTLIADYERDWPLLRNPNLYGDLTNV